MSSICPHCWEFNQPAGRLCGRCGADMRTVLQESGGLRLTAPVQSPVPVRARGRLSPGQRLALLGVVVLLLLSQVLGALLASRGFAPSWTPAPAGDASLD